MTAATGPVHHLAGHRYHPQTGDRLDMATADDKLDRALLLLSDVRVDVGRTAERVEALASQQSARDREVERMAEQHRADMDRLRADIDARVGALEGRPAGLTARQLWSGAAALIATAATLATLIDQISAHT